MRSLYKYLFITLVLSVAIFSAPVRAEEYEEDIEVFEEVETPKAAEPVIKEEVEEVEDDSEEKEQSFATLQPHPDAYTSVIFPNFPTHVFTAGDEVVCLVSFQNKGEHNFNVSYIGISLHSPFDTSFVVQNYSIREVNALLQPNQEATIEYRFKPDVNLEALEYNLQGYVFYNNSEDTFFKTTFFNQTVEIVERSKVIDGKLILTYIFLLIIIAGAGYLTFTFALKPKMKKQLLGKLQGNNTKKQAEWTIDTPKTKKSAKAKTN